MSYVVGMSLARFFNSMAESGAKFGEEKVEIDIKIKKRSDDKTSWVTIVATVIDDDRDAFVLIANNDERSMYDQVSRAAYNAGFDTVAFLFLVGRLIVEVSRSQLRHGE